MAAAANATPLIALDAVVVDTETTGLDPSKARIVEIAAVRLTVGRLTEQGTFRRLVRPDEPIPEAAIRVHGIDDAAVADAAPFADVWRAFVAYAGEGVLIGHSTGFDLAVLKRECERIGAAWPSTVSLDVALLARAVEPNLPGHSLDGLAAWLGIEIVGRHSALGDAAATAKIFLALIPRLRAKGIRTLAEARRASTELTGVLESHHRAGWAEPVPVRPETEPAAPRIDTGPFRRRAGSLMTAPPKSVGPDATIGVALGLMARERISSLLVFPGDPNDPPTPEHTAIVTERDVMRALADHGAAALAMPVARAMSAPLAAVPADALAYLAIGRMNRLRIRHLGVTGPRGEVVGVLSARDLLRLRGQEAVELGDEIGQAVDRHELGRAWAKLPRVARNLRREGLSGREIAAVISAQLGQATGRAAAIAERAMKDEGLGGPPCRYAFVVLGSAGREESLLAMDQDNALITEDPLVTEGNALVAEGKAPEGKMLVTEGKALVAEGRSLVTESRSLVTEGQVSGETWFITLATRVADILHEIGVPYCRGGVMAKNPQWRGSLDDWSGRIADWIRRSSPADLLSVDIFFDLRSVHGESRLAESVWRDAFDAAKGETGFAKLLVEATEPQPSGLNWLGGFRTESGRIDLKRMGLFGIVSTARALAINHHVVERSTPARLAGIKALGLGSEADLDALDDAHACFVDLILKQQLEDIERGMPPCNAVEIRALTRRERDRLRAALRAVEHVDEIARDLLFKT